MPIRVLIGTAAMMRAIVFVPVILTEPVSDTTMVPGTVFYISL